MEHLDNVTGGDMPVRHPDRTSSAEYPHYGALAVTIMSNLLAHDRQTTTTEMYQELAAEGIVRRRANDCVRKVLLRNDLVEVDDITITASEQGIAYVARHAYKIEAAHQEAVRTRKRFPSAQYKILNFLEQETDGDNWLLEGSSTPAMEYLAEHLRAKPTVINRRTNDCHKAGLIEQRMTILPGYSGATIINLRLTETGRAKLAMLRETFPAEITKLDAEVVDDNLVSTAQAMAQEINHMRQQLGESPEDFEDIEAYDASELRTLVGQLTAGMQQLEARLDDPRQPVVAPLTAVAS